MRIDEIGQAVLVDKGEDQTEPQGIPIFGDWKEDQKSTRETEKMQLMRQKENKEYIQFLSPMTHTFQGVKWH